MLDRISSLLGPEKKQLKFNAVIRSHFSYSPLIWMFGSRRSNNLINQTHKRSLLTVYHDTSSTFQELLQRNGSVSIHHKNIQTLATEVLKVVIKFVFQSWRHVLILGKTNTTSENSKKWDSKK